MNDLALKIELKSNLQRWPKEQTLWTGENLSTNMFPTKRALTGMIGCAFGIKRWQKERLAELDKLQIYLEKSIAIPKIVSEMQNVCSDQSIKREKDSGYRYQSDGRLSDFAYPRRRKEYLQDACFHAYILGDKLDEIAEALDTPVYPYFFGAKVCIPSTRVNQGFVTFNEEVKKKCILLS